MRKKLSCLLLSGALALSLTPSLAACSSAGEAPNSSQTPSLPVETEGPSQLIETSVPSEAPEQTGEPVALSSESPAQSVADSPLPDRNYQPWQTAYINFLTALLAEEQANETAYANVEPYTEEAEELWDAIAGSSNSYSLYDVDKDGIPELFVKFGNCEAAYHTRCYAFRDGEAVEVGEFHSGHSNLYSSPNKNAVLLHYGQMGYAELIEYSMVDGRLIEGELLLQEEDVWEYTDASEIVPGARWVDIYYTRAGQMPLLLPVCDWGVDPAPTGNSSEAAQAAILAVLNGERPLYGVSGDGFYGGTGSVTWEEYVQPGIAYPYNRQPFQIVEHCWLDMNGDGQNECILRLESGQDKEEPLDNRGIVMLSEQSGTVYAYYFGFYDNVEFREDGMLSNTYDGEARLSFWKDQCYDYTVQSSAAADVIKWVDGAPAG